MIGYFNSSNIYPLVNNLSGYITGAYEALLNDSSAEAAFTFTTISMNISNTSETLIPGELDINNTRITIGSKYSNSIT